MPRVDRHVAPAEHPLALRLDHVLEEALEAAVPVRQEDDRHAVGARLRQRGAELVPEERVRQPQEHARPVAGVGVGPLRPAVLQVRERRERPLERLVARRPVEARDEGDAAGVVLERRVVEPDCLHPGLSPVGCALVR